MGTIMGIIMGITLIVVFVFVIRTFSDWMSRINEVKDLEEEISKEYENRK